MNGRKHILVVDDEVAILNSLAFSLEGRYRVTTALSGAAALEALRTCAAGGGRVDLLVTDIMLTDMDGLQLIDRIRAAGGRMPALAISGFGTKEIVIGLLQRGVRDYMDKPFEPEDLVARVDRILAEGGPAAGAVAVRTDTGSADHQAPSNPWTIVADGPGAEVRIAGELLDSHGAGLRGDLLDLAGRAPAAVAFQCAGVTHIEYAPLMVLLGFARTARARVPGVHLSMHGASGNLRSLLRVAGMDALYRLEG